MNDYKLAISEIEKSKFHSFYLISGDEVFFTNRIVKLLVKKIINDESKPFDYSILYGKETSVNNLIELARRFPLVSKYNLIIVKDAQYIDKGLDEIVKYVENSSKKSIIVFCYMNKFLDKRKKLYKSVVKYGKVIEFKKLYDTQLPQFINELSISMNLIISPSNAKFMADSVGSDLSAIEKGLKKIKIALKEQKEITSEIIENQIGFSKEFNNFELQNEIGLKNFSKAYHIIKYLSSNPKKHPIVLTLSVMHSFFQKLLVFHCLKNPLKEAPVKLGINPFFVKYYNKASNNYSIQQCEEALSIIYKSDLKIKGINSSSYNHFELLKEILGKIMNL
tara:strand:+ start:155 stop:1159 length:1005 start_codon:yes stop_codon:yes gene_type:complete